MNGGEFNDTLRARAEKIKKIFAFFPEKLVYIVFMPYLWSVILTFS